MKSFIRNHQMLIALLGIILLTIPLIIPFFHPGFFTSHDGEWTVVRLADMYRSIKGGQIPARYSEYLNMRYGYPLFNFAYPAPYYVGLLFVFLKLGFVNSIKGLFVLSTLVSGVGMFLLASKLWKSTAAGIISALLFLYLPYRMVDLYVRGSLGETFSLAIVPFLFLSVYYTVQKRSLIFAGISAILLGFLIPSHNIMALLFTPIALIFAVILVITQEKKAWPHVLVSFVLGLGIAAFFLIPAITEKHLILLAKTPIADRSLYYVSLPQLLFPSWGYGVPTDAKQPFTYQLGIAQLIGFVSTIAALFLTLRTKKNRSIDTTILLTFVILLVPLGFLLFPISKILWEHTPLLSEINYPWTMIAPIGFIVSLAAGYTARVERFRLLTYALGFVAIVSVIAYARPEAYINRGDDFYLTNMATTTSSHEYTPLWVTEIPLQTYTDKVVIRDGRADISELHETATMTGFALNAAVPTTFRINTIYYPGWNMLIDGKSVPLSYTNPQGVMEGKVSEGKHSVQAVFSETPLRMAANLITLISFCIAVVLVGSNFLLRLYEKK